METKKCERCKTNKDISMFYSHIGMSDGHLSFCKCCTKKRVRKYYKNNIKKISEYDKIRNSLPERKLKIIIYNKRKRLKYPRKTIVRWKTTIAIKNGILIRQPCEICGEIKSEAHHADYRSIYKIRWLCKKHHSQVTVGTLSLT